MTDSGRTPFLSAPWMDAPEVKAVMVALGAPQTDARFVGGCVRDTLLDRPVTDIDIATPDPPETVIKKLTAAGLQSVPTGLSHGTITAVSGGRGFETTTLRKDTSTDGRYADVEFTTDWREDAGRRDFTFNAMSLTVNGELFDPFGGENDARAGRVRFIGNPGDRIKEDYLRILRYFRFQAHYGFELPQGEIVDVCRDLKDGLSRLSVERVRDELTKLLTAPDPMASLDAMDESGILNMVLPEARDYRVLASLIERESTLNVSMCAKSWLRRLALLLLDTDDRPRALKRLKLSKKDIGEIQFLCKAAVAAPTAFETPNRNRFLHMFGGGSLDDAVLIAWAKAQAVNQTKWHALWKAALNWDPVLFPLTGKDAKAMGVAEGPEIGVALAQLEQEWVDSDFTLTKNDLRQRLKILAIQ